MQILEKTIFIMRLVACNLWLYRSHNIWRLTLKALIVFLVLGLLGVLGFYYLDKGMLNSVPTQAVQTSYFTPLYSPEPIRQKLRGK